MIVVEHQDRLIQVGRGAAEEALPDDGQELGPAAERGAHSVSKWRRDSARRRHTPRTLIGNESELNAPVIKNRQQV